MLKRMLHELRTLLQDGNIIRDGDATSGRES